MLMDNVIKEYVEKRQYTVMIAHQSSIIYLGIKRLLDEDGKFFTLESRNINILLNETNEVVDILFVDLVTLSDYHSQIERLINIKGVKVVILDDQHHQVNMDELILSDVHGYLDISMSKESFILAINNIIEGKYYFHHFLSKDLIDGYLDVLNRSKFGRSKNDYVDKKNPKVPYTITKRELEIVHLIVDGMNNEQMAEALQVSEKTIKNHLSSIFKKLNVNSRTQVAVIAIKEGWVSL